MINNYSNEQDIDFYLQGLKMYLVKGELAVGGVGGQNSINVWNRLTSVCVHERDQIKRFSVNTIVAKNSLI